MAKLYSLYCASFYDRISCCRGILGLIDLELKLRLEPEKKRANAKKKPASAKLEFNKVMKITRSALLPYAAQQMFDLVADIDAYAEFLSWCNTSTVLQRNSNEVEAELGIRMAAMNLTFSTHNRLLRHERIDMRLASGPFKTLAGHWLFESLDVAACKVSLELDFEFDSLITQKLMTPKFKSIVTSQLDAFQQRAKFVYGDLDA